jgi:DtxR family Mn-dependent transcriptional regulator
MPTKTKENYLKAIYSLSLLDSSVSLSALSREMGVSVPTVNSMVKKLEADKWVKYEKYKPLKITAKGKRAAAMIIRRHRLTEMFLVQVMGFGWEEVHDIAEEMEHIDSPPLFDRMDELLNYPSVDPHGSPIPDKEGKVQQQDYSPLSDRRPGDNIRVCALKDSSTELLIYLTEQEITLGQELTVLKIEAFDKSMRFTMKSGKKLMLSTAVCQCLMTELV